MPTGTLQELVTKAKLELSWPIREVVQENGPLRIFSDAVLRTHTVFLPPAPLEGDQDPALLYLHELGHALLCERIHPFFSSGFPIAGLDESLFPAVSPVLNVASDWFVGHWMMEFCPEVALAELRKEYDVIAEMMDKGEPSTLDKFFVAVLIIAQSMTYLDAQAECSGFLDAAVQTVLSVPPDQPSLGQIETLINALLSLGTPLQCRHINNEGVDVLEFYRPA